VYVTIKAIDASTINVEDSIVYNTTATDETGAIIQFYFGAGSEYTKHRYANTCSLGSITVIHITAGSTPPTSLAASTIYVLDSGNYIVGGTINFAGNCSALVGASPWKGDYYKGIGLGSSSAITNLITATSVSYIIIDNLNL